MLDLCMLLSLFNLLHAPMRFQSCDAISGLCKQLNVVRLAVLLQACGKQPNPSGAVEMLQSAGWWRPHEQLGLIKAQRTDTFPSPVQVPICLQGQFCLCNCCDDRHILLVHGLKGCFAFSTVLDDRQTLLHLRGCTAAQWLHCICSNGATG